MSNPDHCVRSGSMGQGLFSLFFVVFHHFLWLADKFPTDEFPAIGNLSFLELVLGDVVFCQGIKVRGPMGLGTYGPRIGSGDAVRSKQR